jgi:hypothetical protein
LIQDLRNAGVDATISLSKNKIASGQKSLFQKYSTAKCPDTEVVTFDGKVIGIWQGVAMDSLKYHPGVPCPTTLLPAGNHPWNNFMAISGVATCRVGGPRPSTHLLGHPTPYAYVLQVLYKTLKHKTFGEGHHRNVQEIKTISLWWMAFEKSISEISQVDLRISRGNVWE